MALCAKQPAMAQSDGDATSFSVCALNVDGLPRTIAGVTINGDGKGADGATAIGRYLSAKGYDIVAMSEDFNYHANITAELGDAYTYGTWRGGVDAGAAITAADTDGLGLAVKAPAAFSGESWTRWTQCYGKFTNGSDELIRKGYRSYTVALADGTLVDLYIMHMDADVAAADIAARAAQWEQLSEAILAARSMRPVIVMGDTNSRYTRDDLQKLFIAPVTDGGYYTVGDAWVELCQNGVYPKYGDEAMVIPDDKKNTSAAYAEYEVVDKVFYLNSTVSGAAHIEPRSIVFDAEGYRGGDGEMPGDHVPVVVAFEATPATSADIQRFAPADASDWWRGESVYDGMKAYIYNVGQKYFATTDKRPVAKDVANAVLWTATASGDAFKFAAADKAYIHMDYSGWSHLGKWETAISADAADATPFVLAANGTDGAYKLTRHVDTGVYHNTRYLNIDNDNLNYTAAQTQGPDNDWLFISSGQKVAYSDYVRLYTQANSYVGNKALSDVLEEELENTLSEMAHSTYSSSTADNATLSALVDKLKRAVPTAIAKPSAQTGTAVVEAVYTIDGCRTQRVQRGLNIVRMSDGTTRKVMR